ncbi:MAG: hypothetical protein II333_04295 [Clostridia bacterium]|nr:hypothetical protein [Clostridia bacterium]
MTLRELNQLQYLTREIRINRRRLLKLEHSPDTDPDDPMIRKIRAHIEGRIRRRTVECERLERYVNTVDDSLVRMAMILRFIDGLSWTAVAVQIGGGNTDDSIKKMVYRYLKENK